jgi:hypothetical protein
VILRWAAAPDFIPETLRLMASRKAADLVHQQTRNGQCLVPTISAEAVVRPAREQPVIGIFASSRARA